MSVQVFAVRDGLGVESSTNDTVSNWLNGTVDPSVDPGVVAPISSIYTRNVGGSSAEMFQKYGPNDVDWARIASEVQAGVIGPAEDGLYTDGLFTDLVDTTPIGTFVDRTNEILKALSPQPAPTLDYISIAQAGTAAKLSFGATHAISGYSNVTTDAGNSAIDINGTYVVSGTRDGAFVGSVKSGTLNDDITANGQNWIADSFGNGDLGELRLELNGSVIHTVDLTSFASGNSFNANLSGFTLTAAAPVKFTDGTPLDLFKYRTGSWTVTAANQRNGFNYVRVNHFYNSSNHYTGYFEWVADTDANAMSAASGSLHDLSFSGTRTLSGVTYNTSGTALYDVTVNNAYRNVYSTSASAVSFTGTNCTAASQALANCASETDAVTITNKSVAINTGSRLLNASITVGVNCLHPLKSTLSNAQSQSISGILLDAITTANTDTIENFCVETYRVPSVALAGVSDYATQANASGASWDSANSLLSGSGYSEGLLFYNGAVRYPTQGLDAGDFRNVADGNANGPQNGPASNPNYSAASGVRYLYRRFKNSSGATKSNFKVNLAGTSSFASVASGPSGQAVTMEVKFPAGSISTATGWLDAYADFATDAWADGNGCRTATYGAGRATGTDWGLTIGTKSIAANEWIVVRIAAPSTWTGNFSAITLTWL